MNFKTSYFFLTLVCHLPLAQSQTVQSNSQNTCIQEQIREHKSLKANPLTELDFQPYCSCVSGYVEKNATDQQLAELEKAKSKPDWFKSLEKKAFKSCLTPDAKITS
jgi:hypothetical protein